MNFFSSVIFLGILTFLNFTIGQEIEEKWQIQTHMKISRAILTFVGNLFHNTYSNSPTNENLLISPTNIYHALSLVHLAAGGNTLKELSNILGLVDVKNYTKIQLHSAIGLYFTNLITSDADPVIINLADAFFIREGFQIKSGYYDQVKNVYNASVEHIDFRDGPAAANKINSWVANKTRNRIPKVVDSRLRGDTEALITSTLYFNGRWMKPFLKSLTKIEKFSTGKQEIDVQMMNTEKHFRYINDKKWQFEAIDLPYDGSEYAMNIILPHPTQKVNNLIEHLKDISIDEIMKTASSVNLEVKLPKMKFKKSTSLVEPIKKLGVHDLFMSANLTDLSDTSLRVSQIFHGAEIEIDEEGTIATAATVIHVVPPAAPPPPQKPIPFHVNKPFIVHIYRRVIPMVLFTGVVFEPTNN